ncbi:hypothetical protein SDC9_184496 [bioreactor metagenome]|uniref:Uncharacterized protein n=1 Tax=bioreactor metagenome TaxID=1076179 RepID=A0A645HLL2_9ZZZZ
MLLGFILVFQLLQFHTLGMDTLAASTVDISTVIAHFELPDLLELCRRQQVTRHLAYLSAGGADKVIVVLVTVSPLILRYIGSELVFHHQPAVEQQLNGVI